MEMSATSLWSTKLARNPMSPQLLRGIAGRNGSFKSSSTQTRRLLVAFLSHLPSNFSLSDSATQRVTAALSRAGMRSTARDEEGARVLNSALLRLLDLSRWLSLNSWTATACCRSQEASLLAVGCSRTMFRHGTLALAAAERFLRCPGDFDGSRAALEKRQQAAAVHDQAPCQTSPPQQREERLVDVEVRAAELGLFHEAGGVQGVEILHRGGA